MNRYSVAAAAAALSILVASCSSSSKSGTKTTAPPQGSTTSGASTSASGITIKGFQFTGTLTVKAGAKVSVTNSDTVHHTVTDKGGKFDTGEIAGGSSGSFTAPTAPGSYQLKCTFHPQMSGTLVVQ